MCRLDDGGRIRKLRMVIHLVCRLDDGARIRKLRMVLIHWVRRLDDGGRIRKLQMVLYSLGVQVGYVMLEVRHAHEPLVSCLCAGWICDDGRKTWKNSEAGKKGRWYDAEVLGQKT